MRNTTRKGLALFLAVLQLAVLFPLTAFAEDSTATNETPVLNKLKVGNLQFQAFNFLGENTTGDGPNDFQDGKDYTSTFYYTDDYFSPSAINEKATKATMLWSDLDNTHLAACSAAFAFASFTSNEGNVTSNTKSSGKGSWENTDYSKKESNVRSFLTQCEFPEDRIACYGLTEKPTIYSIGYTIASKQITVWDESAKKNKTYTLVAVGVRGAGYDSEWADNVTIGNPETGVMPGGRHYGFDNSAQTVCTSIRDYLDMNHISGDVKYWVTGFSRAAAVANLVAGYLTDNGSTYKTQQKDVYGYTWECPQAASTSENALNYKNIHNIINPMDAVPKVSPTKFGHQRLGVDYQMPYYGNTSSSANTTYYQRMQNVLSTIATAKQSDGSDDPVVTAVANYPYNRPVTIYTVSARQMIDDAIRGNLAKNFGTYEAVTGWLNRLSRGYVGSSSSDLLGGGNWYMDKFIDELIQVFLTSTAWDRDYSGSTTDILTHRTRFINNYQQDFRELLGYLLDYSGPAFLGMVKDLVNAAGDQISDANISSVGKNTGFAASFVGFYFFSLGKESFISATQELAVDIVNKMTNDYPDSENGSGITKSQMNQALRHAVSVVVDLYAVEKDEYKSQYFGTSLHFLNEILCTHLQETVLSWIMSLDDMHMNRSCRTITIPAGCDATLYEFRPEFEGDLKDDLDTSAPVVAEVKNGALVTETLKDQRIYCNTSGGNLVIRYPASLQIRADIKSASVSGFNTSSVRVADYRTTNAYINVSNGKSQYETTTLNSSTGYNSVTSTTATNVTATNNALNNYGVALAAGDTLHILADEIGEYNESKPQTYTLSIDKAPDVTVLDYGTPSDASGTDQSSAILLGVNKTSESTVDNSRSIKTRQTQLTIPASSVYFDDDFSRTDITGNPGDSVYSTMSEFVSGGQKLYFKFSGSRVDVYSTTYNTIKDEVTGEPIRSGYVQAAVYKANGDELGDRVDVVTMKNTSDTVRYNVPTLSFDGLNPGQEYYLVLNILNSSNYKLDGIRVYNGIADQSSYAGTNEQYGAYINLRDALVNNSGVSQAFSDTMTDAILGALFVDDSTKLTQYVTATEEEIAAGEIVLFYKNSEGQYVQVTNETPAPKDAVLYKSAYKNTFDAYKANSPKNEIYLSNGQSIIFKLTKAAKDAAANGNLWIGLSAPDAVLDAQNQPTTDTKNSKVTMNNVETPINSVVDTYYPITGAMIVDDGDAGVVTLTNTGDNLISVTNLKITGNETIYNAAIAAKANTSSVEDAMAATLSVEDAMPLVFAPLTMRTVMLAANDGVDPEVITVEPETPDEPDTPDEPEVIDEPEETPEPTPIPTPTPVPTPAPTPTPRSITSFINAVFRSISRLFRF